MILSGDLSQLLVQDLVISGLDGTHSLLAVPPNCWPHPHTSVSGPLPSLQPFFCSVWPLFSLPYVSGGSNLPILVITITFLKKVGSPRDAFWSCLSCLPWSTSASFNISLLPLINKRRSFLKMLSSCFSIVLSGFLRFSCRIIHRSLGYLRFLQSAAVNSPCLSVSDSQGHRRTDELPLLIHTGCY